MYRLRTLDLPPYMGRDFFPTVFVEPDPGGVGGFDVPADAEEWGISVHFQPADRFESHQEIARIDTAHGEPHFDRRYDPDQPKEWLGEDYTYEDARTELLSNWRRYAEQYFQTTT